jgi:hypothetical protein
VNQDGLEEDGGCGNESGVEEDTVREDSFVDGMSRSGATERLPTKDEPRHQRFNAIEPNACRKHDHMQSRRSANGDDLRQNMLVARTGRETGTDVRASTTQVVFPGGHSASEKGLVLGRLAAGFL